MAIEDYIDLADLYIDNDTRKIYSNKILEDLKNNKKRYCIDCWSEMKISKKWNIYCSSICWENNIWIINEKNQEEEQKIYDLI